MVEPIEPDLSEPGIVWMSMSDLADEQGVHKSMISRNVAKIEREGQAITKPGHGKERLVNVAEYIAAMGKNADLSHQLGAETARANRDANSGGDNRYQEARTKREQLEAALKGIELRKQTGALVEITNVKEVIAEVGEEIKKPLEQISLRADDIAAAARAGGATEVRKLLAQIIFDLRAKITDALRKLDIRGQASGNAGDGGAA